MLEVKMRSKTFTLFASVLLLLALSAVAAAQDPAQDVAPDPIEQLRLTPEQRQRIRMIREETQNERQIANRRLREANVALDQALDAEPVNEAVIEQRVNELAAAQAAQLRMRIQMELKIRRVLRPEQLAVLRQLHLQIRDVMGGQRNVNTFNQRPGREGLRPDRRNRPNFPHRNINQP
jgi:Spy/CpxP family protein refolding chaperone